MLSEHGGSVRTEVSEMFNCKSTDSVDTLREQLQYSPCQLHRPLPLLLVRFPNSGEGFETDKMLQGSGSDPESDK